MPAYTGPPWLSVAVIATRTLITVPRRPAFRARGESSSMTCLMVSGIADVHLAMVSTLCGSARFQVCPPFATSWSWNCMLYSVTLLWRMICNRHDSSSSVRQQSGLKMTCLKGFSARATITAPAMERSSQWNQPCNASTATSAPDDALRPVQPKMLSVDRRTAVRLSKSFDLNSDADVMSSPVDDFSSRSTANITTAKSTMFASSSTASSASRREMLKSTVSRCQTSSAKLTES